MAEPLSHYQHAVNALEHVGANLPERLLAMSDREMFNAEISLRAAETRAMLAIAEELLAIRSVLASLGNQLAMQRYGATPERGELSVIKSTRDDYTT